MENTNERPLTGDFAENVQPLDVSAQIEICHPAGTRKVTALLRVSTLRF